MILSCPIGIANALLCCLICAVKTVTHDMALNDIYNPLHFIRLGHETTCLMCQ